ncbi:hypothetical protein WBU87_22725 [Escherichia coli]
MSRQRSKRDCYGCRERSC